MCTVEATTPFISTLPDPLKLSANCTGGGRRALWVSFEPTTPVELPLGDTDTAPVWCVLGLGGYCYSALSVSRDINTVTFKKEKKVIHSGESVFFLLCIFNTS